MPTLYISEFASLKAYPFTPVMPAAVAPSLADQAGVTIGAASAQSDAVGTQTQLVRLFADANCSVKFGTDPTATNSSTPLAANMPEYFQVPAGSALKIAVIVRT